MSQPWGGHKTDLSGSYGLWLLSAQAPEAPPSLLLRSRQVPPRIPHTAQDTSDP